jgi:hypothetical protein
MTPSIASCLLLYLAFFDPLQAYREHLDNQKNGEKIASNSISVNTQYKLRIQLQFL